MLLAACTSSPTTPFTAVVEAGVDGFVYVPVVDASADVVTDADAAGVTFLDVPFVCGGTMCAPATHYCLHVLPEGGLTPEAGDPSDMCLPIPTACLATPSCACVENLAACEAGVEGEGCIEGAGVEITCPAY